MENGTMTRTPKISPDAPPVAREVLRRMVLSGIGQKALSIKAGLNDTYVRDLLLGKSRNPRTEHLRALAQALGCSVEDLTSPDGAAEPSALQEFINPVDVMPLHAMEISLVKLWRHLDAENREQLLMRGIELLAGKKPRR